MFEDCSLSVIAKAKYNNSKTVRTQTPSIYRPRPRKHTRTLSLTHTHTQIHTQGHTHHIQGHTHHTHTQAHIGTYTREHTPHTHTPVTPSLSPFSLHSRDRTGRKFALARWISILDVANSRAFGPINICLSSGTHKVGY